MMALALEEYDRQADKKTSKQKDTGVAMSTISSEKPGSKTGGGKGGKGKGPRKPLGFAGTVEAKATSRMSAQPPSLTKSPKTRRRQLERGIPSQSQQDPLTLLTLLLLQHLMKSRAHGVHSVWMRLTPVSREWE